MKNFEREKIGKIYQKSINNVNLKTQPKKKISN